MATKTARKTASKTAATTGVAFQSGTEWEAQLNMTEAQLAKVQELNTSDRIRFLASEGYTRGEITKMIPNAHGRTLLYQHVRNVLVGPTPKAESKSK